MCIFFETFKFDLIDFYVNKKKDMEKKNYFFFSFL